ncbi:RNA-directed DNA polymerase, eukaryota [Tanacetum coccineum]
MDVLQNEFQFYKGLKQGDPLSLSSLSRDGEPSLSFKGSGSGMTYTSLVRSFRRIPRGGIEQNQFDSLVELVRSVTIVPSADRWNWNLESTGIFSVASARRRIDEICLPNIGEETRWVKCVPIKINVLAWKIKTDALPTRFNISRRGIDIQDMSCPICDNAIESTDHLFFRCGLVRDIANKVLSWWNLDHANLNSYAEWKSWLVSIRMDSKLKKMFEGVWLGFFDENGSYLGIWYTSDPKSRKIRIRTLTSWLSNEIPDAGAFTDLDLDSTTRPTILDYNKRYISYKKDQDSGYNAPFPMWILTPEGQIDGGATDDGSTGPKILLRIPISHGLLESSLPLCRRETDIFTYRNGDFTPHQTSNATDITPMELDVYFGEEATDFRMTRCESSTWMPGTGQALGITHGGGIKLCGVYGVEHVFLKLMNQSMGSSLIELDI